MLRGRISFVTASLKTNLMDIYDVPCGHFQLLKHHKFHIMARQSLSICRSHDVQICAEWCGTCTFIVAFEFLRTLPAPHFKLKIIKIKV